MLNPVIKATFELDEEGRPKLIQDGELKHYKIQLSVDNAPDDAYAVTYLLDETYYDPVRESRDNKAGFTEDLTSYGDFTVQAKIRTRQGITTIATPLSGALTAGHEVQVTPAITDAIRDIKEK